MEYAVYIAIAAVVIVVAAVIFMPKPVTHTKLDLSSPKVNIPEKLSDKLLRINEELGPAILESLRAQEAENGRAFTLPVGQVFLADTLRIMYSFMKANDGATYAMGTFLSEIAPTLHPHVASQLELCPDGRAQGARQLLSKLAETNDGEVKLPQTLCSLSDFDNEHRTQHVIRMARFYCDFVAYLSKSGKTEFADANRVVESRYMELIAAYTEKVQVGQLTTDTPTLPPSTEEDDEWERLGRRFAAFAGADGHSVWLRFLPAGLQFEDADSCIMTDIACVLKTFCIGNPCRPPPAIPNRFSKGRSCRCTTFSGSRGVPSIVVKTVPERGEPSRRSAPAKSSEIQITRRPARVFGYVNCPFQILLVTATVRSSRFTSRQCNHRFLRLSSQSPPLGGRGSCMVHGNAG